MTNKILSFSTILLAITACGENQKQFITFQGEDCTVGIFTKALNTPKYKFEKDTLTIHSGSKTDFFNAPDTAVKRSNAPLLLKKIDNTKPFTFLAKVRPAFSEVYDAGCLFIYSCDDLWQKFAFEMDERGVSRMVTVRTINTSDDNNHDAVLQKEVYMKISSDTKKIGFYYSLEGLKWQLVRLYKNDYPTEIYLGLSSQAPQGEGMNTHFCQIKFENKAIADFRMGL